MSLKQSRISHNVQREHLEHDGNSLYEITAHSHFALGVGHGDAGR